MGGNQVRVLLASLLLAGLGSACLGAPQPDLRPGRDRGDPLGTHQPTGGPRAQPSAEPDPTAVGCDSHVAVIVASRSLEIAATRAGLVAGLEGALGRRVDEGQLLFTVVQSGDEARTKAARATVTSSSAERRRAALERDHSARDARESAALGPVLARRERDAARDLSELRDADSQAARGREQVARAQLEALESTLLGARVTAPFAGRVTALDVQPGAWVGTGGTVLRLEASDGPRVRFALSPRRARMIGDGDFVGWGAEGAGCGGLEGFTRARVVRRDPVVDPVSGLVMVEARIEGGEMVELGTVVEVVLLDPGSTPSEI